MVNMLVVEDNILQGKELVNVISKELENIRLYNLSVSGKEALDIIKLQNIDIILLDLNLPDISGLDILSYISDSNIEKYINSIFIVSGDSSLITCLPSKCYSYICTVLHKPIVYENLIYRLSEIVKLKNDIKEEDIVKSKINKELEYLKFNFSYNGTRYLAEAIFELYCNRANFVDNFKRDIFPVLAKKHNKTASTIEGNIKQSINCMFFDCDENILIEYFHYSFIIKPKLKEICFTILNKIL